MRKLGPEDSKTVCTAPLSVQLTHCVSQALIANVPDCGALLQKIKGWMLFDVATGLVRGFLTGHRS